jgi:hypothetical protein
MGSKSKAPEYQPASYDSGLWGSSTTDKSGTRYNPTGWINNTMQTVGTNLNPTLQSMVNNDFMKDPNFIRYQNQFTENMNDLYDTSVLSNLANRGLMRSSGLQGATNAFNDTLAKNQLNLYDNYYSRLNNNLSNLLNTSNTLYNYMTGVNQGSQQQAAQLNNYNLEKTKIDNAGNNGLFGTIANGIGSVAGLAGGIATGNPFSIASGIGGTANTLSGLSGGGSSLSNALLGATRVGMPTSIY